MTSSMAPAAVLHSPGSSGGRRTLIVAGLAHALHDRFGVRHATLQIEQSRDDHCPDC